jgi:RNA polymerase sigma factor (sigma-70 family)
VPDNAHHTRASLLLQLRDVRNDAAWTRFVEIYTPIVYGFCRNRDLQDADAADVSQEVMRAVARAMEKFEYDPQRGKFRNWLLTVARSKLNNFFNRRQRQPEPHGNTSIQNLMDAEPTQAEQSSWDKEYHGRLFHWAAEQLRPTLHEKTWQAFWRTTMQEEDAATVAGELQLSVGAVYVARSRVLARLKEKILSVDPEMESWPERSSPVPRSR